MPWSIEKALVFKKAAINNTKIKGLKKTSKGISIIMGFESWKKLLKLAFIIANAKIIAKIKKPLAKR